MIMRILGGSDDGDGVDKGNKSGNEELVITGIRSEKEQVMIHDLMQTVDGKKMMLESISKNCFVELNKRLNKRLNKELSPTQIKLLKVDVGQECSLGLYSIPSYLLVDDDAARTVLQKQIDVILGMVVERLEFKYMKLFDVT